MKAGAVANASPLKQLYECLAAGESIPLPWVVAHGQNFPKLWKASDDPKTMIRIVSRVVPKESLVLIAAEIAEAAPYKIEDWSPTEALRMAKTWARTSADATGPTRPDFHSLMHAANDSDQTGVAYFSKDPTRASAIYALSDVARLAVVGGHRALAAVAVRVVEFALGAVAAKERPSRRRKRHGDE